MAIPIWLITLLISSVDSGENIVATITDETTVKQEQTITTQEEITEITTETTTVTSETETTEPESETTTVSNDTSLNYEERPLDITLNTEITD